MDDDQHYYEDDRLYPSGRDSDDSPILSNRYEYRQNRRYASYVPREERSERRSTLTALAKFFLFSSAMILFCVLLYIPVYNKASDQLTKDLVVGWSKHTNRDTKVYVQPNNVTSIHEPRHLCRSEQSRAKHKLFLLIVVCSATDHFDSRLAIRDTWGNQHKYLHMSKLYHDVKQKYTNYNFTYDLYNESADINNETGGRSRRDMAGFNQLLPQLAKALQDNLDKEKTDKVPEKRFEDDDNAMLPEFDMNQEIGEQTDIPNYDYYDTNVMKIPPKGYEDNPDLEKVLSILRHDKNLKENLPKVKEEAAAANAEPDFKVVFLLGLPSNDNDSSIQNKIVEEAEKYGDIIQEGFIDSYNNLTLKSIMMLKWITNNCNDSVRYILKTDDDMYINVPNLVENLRNRSRQFELRTQGRRETEHLLIGDLICGARPVLDATNKWYSPRYMYGGRVYPKYLSGTGYALSGATARALYDAALRTNYFHLEDIFITGMCAGRAHPRIIPRDDPTFSYQAAGAGGHAGGGPPGVARAACGAHARATAHRVTPQDMRQLHKMLANKRVLDTCERMRLTKVRKDRLKPKTPPKRVPRH